MLLCSVLFLLGIDAQAQEPENTPQTAETPQEETGVLKVTSSTVSQVYIDHKVVGSTPLEINIPAGKHVIRVVADGYDPFVRKIKIAANEPQNLSATLNRGGGTVEFASPIPKATVRIDGKEDHILPYRLKNATPGEHSWTLSAPGHEDKTGSLVFSAGQNLYVYTDLMSSAGLAIFETTPPGAEVFMEKAYTSMGVTPYNAEGLELKEHTVLLKAKGYAAAFRTMDNQDGNKGIIKTSLSMFGADVSISTNHKDAIVRVEGIEVGEGKKVSLGKVERGIYDLFVTTPEGLSASTRMNVPSNGSIHFHANLYPESSTKKSSIAIIPPLWNQWYFWAGVGGAVAITGVSSAIAIDLNQPIPAPKGDAAVTLP